MIAEIVLRCAETEVSLRPVWFQANRLSELFSGLARVAFILQREREIVMRVGVVGFKFEGFAIVGDGSVPGLRAGKINGLFTIGLGSLGEARAGEDEN